MTQDNNGSTRGGADHTSPRQGYEEALQELRQHPGWMEYGQCEALRWSLTAVFEPNLRELLKLLEAASTNHALALQLVQNVAPPVVADAFHRELAQRLHNYLAGAASLVDHVRRLMSGRTGEVASEFAQRKLALAQDPEVCFVQDLRNYTLHRSLPITGHRLTIRKDMRPEFESEVTLSIPELLEWDKWSALGRQFLASHTTPLALRPIVHRHGTLFFDINVWLYETLSAANDEALADANRLVIAANAKLMGVSVAEAERYTRERDERRRLPDFGAKL